MSSSVNQRQISSYVPDSAGAQHAARDRIEARIGPNSVLQLVQVLDAHLGTGARRELLVAAGLSTLPPENGLMPEGPAARLHQTLRRHYPEQAATLAREAGERTGDYIIAHRIPPAARRLLRCLPVALSYPLLMRAISRHAWTFAGSGDFRLPRGQRRFLELHDNPIVRGERADHPLCHWHAAVFQRLFTALVDPDMRCTELACCAMGAPACRFALYPAASRRRSAEQD